MPIILDEDGEALLDEDGVYLLDEEEHSEDFGLGFTITFKGRRR